MKPIELRIYRFGSFREEVVFRFPAGAGLYFLRGDNREEPELGANGAGKSTLWNALCWVIFDRTVKGLRAGDAANWDEPKGAKVEFTYETDDGQIRIVTRQHSPNKWNISLFGMSPDDLTKDESNQLLIDLRLELEPFLNAILIGQGRSMFLDLTATKKAELFSDVLGLDVWLDRAGKASTKAAAQDKVSQDLERRLARVEGQLGEIDHASLDGSASEWKADRDAKLKRMEERHARALADRRARTKTADKLADRVEERRAFLKAANEAEVQAREKAQEATRMARHALNGAETRERWLNEQSKARAQFLKLAECPECRQEVPHEHRERIAEEMQARITPKAHEMIGIWEFSDKAKKAADDADKIWSMAVELTTDCQNQLRKAEQDLKEADNEIAFLDRDLDRLEDEAEELEEQRNPFAAMRQEALNREENLQAQRRDLERRLDDSRERHFLYAYWVRGFKEMRLQAIHESLEQLEVEVNSKVVEYGLLNWELRFEIDKETKGGGITRGFNVLVLSPHNSRAVPFEAWSGGEGQRLRLATQAGLADLIRSRTGCDLPLEVWDEPTEHLSPQGVVDLLDALRDRARQENRQIWVVDHRSLGYGGFTGVVTAIKDERGSRFEAAV